MTRVARGPFMSSEKDKLLEMAMRRFNALGRIMEESAPIWLGKPWPPGMHPHFVVQDKEDGTVAASVEWKSNIDPKQ